MKIHPPTWTREKRDKANSTRALHRTSERHAKGGDMASALPTVCERDIVTELQNAMLTANLGRNVRVPPRMVIEWILAGKGTFPRYKP